MLKNINLFIVSLLVMELISLLLGYGTHFEHYKYAVMLSIVVLNYLFIKRQSKIIVLQTSKNKQP